MLLGRQYVYKTKYVMPQSKRVLKGKSYIIGMPDEYVVEI